MAAVAQITPAVQKAEFGGRIPSLDGWRGVAILLVIAAHSILALRRPDLAPIAESIGKHGVTIFFVLSGYLITTRLETERASKGSIHLGQFYWRRFLRLMPAAWTYLAFWCVWALLAGVALRSLELPACLFFFRNYNDAQGSLLTGHYWSLSIEEQFYLIWPTLLAVCGAKRARWISLVGCAAVVLWRFHQRDYLHHLVIPHPTMATQYRADALLIGCAAALFLPYLRNWLRPWMIPFLGTVVIAGIILDYTIVPVFESITIALLLITTSHHPDTWFGRALNWRPLVSIGLVSYSLYLWQEILFLAHNILGLIFIGFTASALAIASYCFIEQPCILLGRRLSLRATARSSFSGGASRYIP